MGLCEVTRAMARWGVPGVSAQRGPGVAALAEGVLSRVIPTASHTNRRCGLPYWAIASRLRAPQAIAHTAIPNTLANW